MFGRRKREDDDVEGIDEVLDDDLDDEDPLGDDVEEELDDDDRAPLSARPDGPWDVSEVTDPGDHLDLGSLWLRPVVECELRFEVDEATGVPTTLTCVSADHGAVTVLACAAPRSEGIWPDVRRELRQQITASGGLVDEVEGPWGTEIRTQLPATMPDGTQAAQPARFAGVDGPRWFLRLVFHGPAAADPESAAVMESMVRAMVVVRDAEARAPGDLLPLRLPQATDPGITPAGGGEADDADDSDDAPWQREDVSPFERGPEITEIR